VLDARMRMYLASTAMASVIERKSQSTRSSSGFYVYSHRKLSESIQEANSLNQHNSDILEALRRIRLDPSLSLDSIRAAIDDVLSMV
jgi:hypothetical protein